mmetsp:Transcript_8518/g.18149  ORF Transcript_8518/g.18149 Transcript_8518/m.18149 type:complete len:171 (-) Transcript_8518:55-567(-)
MPFTRPAAPQRSVSGSTAYTSSVAWEEEEYLDPAAEWYGEEAAAWGEDYGYGYYGETCEFQSEDWAPKCKNGPTCRFLAMGTCVYSHAEEEDEEEYQYAPELPPVSERKWNVLVVNNSSATASAPAPQTATRALPEHGKEKVVADGAVARKRSRSPRRERVSISGAVGGA